MHIEFHIHAMVGAHWFLDAELYHVNDAVASESINSTFDAFTTFAPYALSFRFDIDHNQFVRIQNVFRNDV